MAGLGSRFALAGYEHPKPLIDIIGMPMIERVIESLELDGQYIFIVQKEHSRRYDLVKFLRSIAKNSIVIEIDGQTDGAARTTLMARHVIDNDTPLIIANSDQIVEWDSFEFVNLLKSGNPIALFNSDEEKWSYAEISNNVISRVEEKRVISNNASVGIYGWQKGSDYVKYVDQMISKDIRTNNEFYICPVYNEAILDGKVVLPYFVSKMHGVGTPADLKKYLDMRYNV